MDGWMESESGQVCRSGTEGKEGRTHCCLMDMNTRKVRRSKKVVWRRLMLLLLSELLFASRWSRVGWCGGGEDLRGDRHARAQSAASRRRLPATSLPLTLLLQGNTVHPM